MKIVLSPAKSLNFDNVPTLSTYTQPQFLTESEKLVKKLKKLSSKKIGKLMSISPQLSDLNYGRFQEWSIPFTNENSKAAMYVFTGDAYRGMDSRSFSETDIVEANRSLRILSGLYGLLKPSDIIQPYRLEMGTSFAVTPTTKGLYQFWGDKIVDQLNKELAEDDGILVNVASNEYFKAVNLKKLKGQLITCSFKERKGDEYKMIMTFAKFARGLMSRFIIQNKLKEVEHLKAFDLDGYMFSNQLSTDSEFVFTRG
jgi:cytoplasmic iron level regulating protein YaaA (DUF328/UPF0246 family)